MSTNEIPFRVGEGGAVTFTTVAPGAAKVALAGDFTGWKPVPLTRGDGDRWSLKSAPLAPGRYQYKYIVDGRWRADPENRLDGNDGHGGRNSVFVVGAPDLGDPRALRVLSLNLHTWQEPDAHEKLETIALGAAVLGADLLILQEVGEHVSDPAQPNAGEIVRRHLARFTGRDFSHEWRMAHIGFDHYREGVSLISAAPLERVACHTLSDSGLARVALVAETTLGGVRLRVASTHVGWGAAGGEEVRRLVAALDAGASTIDATLVCGDFNADAHEPQVRRFVEAGFTDIAAASGKAVPTFLDAPIQRIDYQLLRPGARLAPRTLAVARVFDHTGPRGSLQARVSDHAGLVVAYSWP